MIWRRRLVILVVLVIGALLAFPLRGLVNQLVVIPLAYILWLLGLLYLSLHQAFWWVAVILVVLIILGRSLLPEIKFVKKNIPLAKHERGSVEELAVAMQKSNQGIYFKWLVANRLGRLAYQILLQREHGKTRSVFAPLAGEGWESTNEVQQYLEKGLHGSFAEFPNSRWNYFAPPEKTPLDQNVIEVIEFLETKANLRSDRS